MKAVTHRRAQRTTPTSDSLPPRAHRWTGRRESGKSFFRKRFCVGISKSVLILPIDIFTSLL